ncbi:MULTISPECIES: Ycf66 family protein [Planktothrix]|uniref:Ycf66 family protein n=1 Tax=Planktothrix TaxID=54304 RepID=UPI000687CB6E|nr:MULTISPECIES: Ycf66 family protein [Planktothrix]
MLAYILAIAVGLASFGLYMAAFFFPEVHRKSDFVWSGVGLFYGLILWACAGRITGAVLLGQVASVSLLIWFGWEVLTLRRTATPVTEQTPIPAKVKKRVKGLIGVQSPVIFPEPVQDIVTTPEPVFENNPVVAQTPVETQEQPEPEVISPSPEIVEEPPLPPITEEQNLPEVEETPSVTPLTSDTPVKTPKVKADKPPVIPKVKTAKTTSKTQKSIPALAGTLSGFIGNLTGLFNKKPKTPSKPKSPEPTPVPPVKVIEDNQKVATDEFAEFEDLETKIVEENSTPKTAVSVPEILEEVEKPAPSPFEQIITSQVEGVVEIITEQVNPIVEEIQESVTEEISSETNNLEPETVVEVITISEIETASETLESEEINPSPLVTPEPSDQK